MSPGSQHIRVASGPSSRHYSRTPHLTEDHELASRDPLQEIPGVGPSIRPVLESKANRRPQLNRRQAFQAAASDLDATFVVGKRSSGDEVHLEHGPWKVILDTYVQSTGQTSVTYTRARALYVAKEDFKLGISRRNVFTRIAELFGFYGLLVGDQELEGKYTIKSSSDPRGRSLMMDRRLRELIMVQPSLGLEIRRLSWGMRRKRGGRRPGRGCPDHRRGHGAGSPRELRAPRSQHPGPARPHRRGVRGARGRGSHLRSPPARLARTPRDGTLAGMLP